MEFVNLTPHSITVRMVMKAEVIISASGSLARCTVTSTKVGELDGVPVFQQTFGDPIGIPSPIEGTIYITSTVVAQAAKRRDVVSPDTGPTAIRQDGQVIAVRGFQTFVNGWGIFPDLLNRLSTMAGYIICDDAVDGAVRVALLALSPSASDEELLAAWSAK